MKAASHAVVRWKEMKPLPGELTAERINNATLPVKIEAARRAIALCTDLPELLRYRDQAEGLAAAVRTMKHVGPEMIKNANCLMADAWRKGGELLGKYSNAVLRNSKGVILGGKAPRKTMADSLGLATNEATNLVRIAKAPAKLVHAEAQRSRNLHLVAKRLPSVANTRGSVGRSDAYRGISTNLSSALTHVNYVDLGNFKRLDDSERKIVKAKLTEIIELLDEMDRLCR